MSRHVVTHTANDNDPRNTRPDGDAAGFRLLLREREMERRLHKVEMQQLLQNGPPMTAHVTTPASLPAAPIHKGLILALICTLCATLATAYCYYAGESIVFRVMSLVAMVWSALWVTYLASEDTAASNAKPKRSSFIAEFAITIATIAGLAIWIMASREWGLPLSAADGVAGFAGLTAITAGLLRSRLSLIVSAISGLIWLALYTQVPSINLISVWMYPVLAGIQLVIAGQDNVKFATFAALTGVYGWLFWILNARFAAGDISLLHVCAMCMMMGFAHFRLGKAAGDSLWAGANLHIVFGWALAVAGTIGLQHFWLGSDSQLWQDTSAQPLGQLSWQIIGGAGIALIGVAGLIRMAYKQMSGLAVLFSLSVALGAAALFDQRDMLKAMIQSELNMPATPVVGMVIGAAVLASSVAMCLNGARRKSNLMMVAGLAAIAVELVLLMQPGLWTAETGLAFVMAGVAGLCLAALFAAEPAPRLA